MSEFIVIHLAAVLVAWFAWQTHHATRAASRGTGAGAELHQPCPTVPASTAHDVLLREDRARARRAKLRAELFTARTEKTSR